MENTVGIFLITKSNEVLICHPTYNGYNTWSIPKGLKKDYESDWSAGIRELYEETHVDYEVITSNIKHITRLDDVKYPKKNKKLTPYVIKLKNNDIMDIKLSCDSFVEIEGRKPFPEVDMFKWVSIDEALKLIHITQKIALKEYINKWN